MKRLVALLLAGCTLCFVGCRTAHHSTVWEYKVYKGVVGDPVGDQGIGAELNRLAAEGGTVQSFSPMPDAHTYYVFLLKRPKQ